MFKSIFLEGFSRPTGGVRTIINLLLEKFQTLGGELRFNSKVTKILTKENKITGVIATIDNKEQEINCDKILSSMGIPETYSCVLDNEKLNESAMDKVGKLSFTETILITDKKPSQFNIDATIIFHNHSSVYKYQRPNQLFDNSSAVICFPDNFKSNSDSIENEGVIRLTNMANFDLWKNAYLQSDKTHYKKLKNEVYEESLKILNRIGIESQFEILFKDVFTPTTIERYTGHFQGTVYGSIEKSKMGTTPIHGLFICGTDQGFLGIVGSMLSGISMANLHVLSGPI